VKYVLNLSQGQSAGISLLNEEEGRSSGRPWPANQKNAERQERASELRQQLPKPAHACAAPCTCASASPSTRIRSRNFPGVTTSTSAAQRSTAPSTRVNRNEMKIAVHAMHLERTATSGTPIGYHPRLGGKCTARGHLRQVCEFTSGSNAPAS
jgi:hypothetical protein